MSKFVKTLMFVLGFNILVLVVLLLNKRSDDALGIAIFWLVSILLQFLAGLMLLLEQRNRKTGQAILLGVGIGLLIGFSVCSLAL